MMLLIGICLVCLTWLIVIGLCMNLIENKYQERKSKTNKLYEFAKKNDLSPSELRELYDIYLDE